MEYTEHIAESKKNHLWRKTVWHSDPDEHPLMAAYSAEIYCCEEVNGFAVWYARRLGKSGPSGASGVDNGDYLLRFFSPMRRDEAIEWAVLISNSAGNSAANVGDIITALDHRIAEGQKV